jgi:acetyl/propionyl-CoA carboxylase alpha subunit
MSSSAADDEVYVTEADRIGYPVLVKAAAGGGGKGMRAVRSREELVEALAGARRESQAAFGDPTVFIEKLVERPRHRRDPGARRRARERRPPLRARVLHPAAPPEDHRGVAVPGARPRAPRADGEAALEAVHASGYRNAGTVEFLLDADRSFYFLEVNARIQVEHPVTELVTGLDLVELQLAVSDGEPLPFTQEDLSLRGHALECRVYAEDPATGFLPSAGPILALREPSGPGIRVDSASTRAARCPSTTTRSSRRSSRTAPIASSRVAGCSPPCARRRSSGSARSCRS